MKEHLVIALHMLECISAKLGCWGNLDKLLEIHLSLKRVCGGNREKISHRISVLAGRFKNILLIDLVIEDCSASSSPS